MGKKVSTTQLIDEIAARTVLPKSDVQAVLSNLAAVIAENLAQDTAVTISSLGTFKPSQRAARTGRNPRTGEPVEIAASTSASFKAAKALKDALN